MRVTGDLGFSSLVLVICFVFPVFLGFVIRRKWRLAVARNEEIKRLLVLASEEAARAELEAYTNYGSAPLPVPQGGNCAVCYCPTTTRCARCKAVRYCSGKCQIIHWRQGHKEECHPPEAGSDFGGSGARSGQNIYERETMEGKVRPYAKDGEAFRNEQISAQSSCSEVLSLKDENMSVEFHEASSTESSDVFSGFSSATHSESSDDTSVCESIISDDCVRPDEALSEDNTHSVSGTTCSKIADQVEPLSPKFASLVDSVVNSRSSTALDKNKSGCVEDGDQCRSGSPSGLSCSGLHEDSMCRPSGHPSCFWSTLDEQRNIAHDNCSSSSCKGVGECGKSDSESALQFSFNLSEKTLPPLHQQDFNNADKKPESRSALRENESADCSSAAHSPLRKLELLNCIGDEGSNNKPALKLSGSDRVSSSSVQAGISLSRTACSSEMDGCKLRNSSSGGPPVEDTCTTGTSHESRSREAVYVSSSGADVLKAGVHLSSFGRIGKDENGQTHSMISSRDVVHLPSTRNGSKKSVWRVLDQFKGSMLPKPNRSGVGYDAALKCNDKGAFPYQLFLKLYTWKGVELHPRGLVNCGNSCYANVVLQCLAFTPPLTAYFLQGLHSKECQQKDWCFSCQFESLVLKMNEGKSPISPTGIVSQLRKIGRQLGDGREEDAHEFLRCAIDKMQSDCLVNSGKDVSNLKEETTLIGLTFGGYLRSKIRCTRCNVKSERHERMMDLTVEIGGDIRTLEEALKQFTSTEILDGENKYQCTRCNSYEKAKKRLSVLEAPNVLTIALKRFQSGKFGKLNKSIRFSEILDLSSCVRGSSDSSAVYRLYGVIVHLDIMNAAFSGHYVCYVKNMHNKWFKVDDSTVKPVELDRVLTKGAYMLLYARCLPQPPRLLRDGVTSCDSKNQPIGYKTGGRSTAVRSGTTHSRNSYHRSLSSNDSIRAGSFYTEFPQMHRNRQEDSCSDASSLFSSNSDESSCSTVSTQDSPSYDELSDYIFGDSGSSWSGSPWSNASQQDTSLSPSPFLVRR